MTGRPNRAHFPKEDFSIDLEAGTCTCPAGKVTRALRSMGSLPDGHGGRQRLWGFVFDGRACRTCTMRPNCVSAKNRRGRTVRLHPQEALLQQARALQHSEAFIEYRKRRQVSEHRLARLVQLGIRQARYFGRAKTLFQLLMAATVANLTLVATRMGMMGKANQTAVSFFALFYRGFTITIAALMLRLPAVTIPLPVLTTGRLCSAERSFRLSF